jgi:hypothetical protein
MLTNGRIVFVVETGITDINRYSRLAVGKECVYAYLFEDFVLA